MADNNQTSSAADGEQHITFNVKSSAEAKYVLTVSTSTTIGDLKQKLSQSDYAGIPPERQRLIYSGRVLKDADTVASVKIKDGNTVHLVRGAESNQRQAPANQGGSSPAPAGAGQPASNVPSNIAAGTGTGNPLAHLTGARYAGFHGLPGADMFGADGGMGAPPNPDQMLRMLDDPNFAQQMNEAMNNPAVLDMFRNNPMIRNNPVARAVMENPELRRMMFSPDMIRMQMQMQRSLGQNGRGGGGEGAFPMPGQTDTTPSSGSNDPGTNATPNQANAETNNPQSNPFAALFGPGQAGGGAGGDNGGNLPSGTAAPPPFGSLFGGGQQNQNPMADMTQRIMQDPEMMQRMMGLMGGAGSGGEGEGAGAGAGVGGFNPFAAFGGAPTPQAPPDNRPPEERYAEQLRQLNDMGFYEFERNVQALRRSGGSVQGAVEYLLSQPPP